MMSEVRKSIRLKRKRECEKYRGCKKDRSVPCSFAEISPFIDSCSFELILCLSQEDVSLIPPPHKKNV